MAKHRRRSSGLGNVIGTGVIGVTTAAFTTATANSVASIPAGPAKNIANISPTLVATSGLGAMIKRNKKYKW